MEALFGTLLFLSILALIASIILYFAYRAKNNQQKRKIYRSILLGSLAVMVVSFIGLTVAVSNEPEHTAKSHPSRAERIAKAEGGTVDKSIKEINFEDENTDDFLTYKVKNAVKFNAYGGDSWKTAPAKVYKVQLVDVKKAKKIKPKYLADNLPTSDKVVNRFLIVYFKIPNGYKVDLKTGMDGGGVTLPAKGNPKYANELQTVGFIVDGEGNNNLINNSTGDKELDPSSPIDYSKETKKGTLNITNNAVVIPLTQKIKALHPLTYRFWGHTPSGSSHLYMIKVDWKK